jgi:hypothetical protein
MGGEESQAVISVPQPGSSTAKRGRGTTRSVVEGAATHADAPVKAHG